MKCFADKILSKKELELIVSIMSYVAIYPEQIDMINLLNKLDNIIDNNEINN